MLSRLVITFLPRSKHLLISWRSVRPHRRQPTRLPCPWDSPGKNTGVGCHFLLQCMKVESESEVAQSCLTPSDPMDCSPPGPSIHGIFQARVLEWSAIAFSAKLLQLCPILCDTMNCSLSAFSIHGILQARILEWVAMPSPGDLPNPGIEPRSPALQADSLPLEPQGKPKNTGVGSLSFLQGIFPTQESNWGLLPCRWILYQLNYQGSFNHFPTLQASDQIRVSHIAGGFFTS